MVDRRQRRVGICQGSDVSVHRRAHHDEEGARERPGAGDKAGGARGMQVTRIQLVTR